MAAQSKKESPLLNAYLVLGEDALKRNRVMTRLRKRLETMGDLTFNSDTFDGQSAKGTDIVSACRTMPFVSDVRLVEVENVEKLKKEDAEALVAYLGAPSATTVLILIAEKLAKNTRLYKAVSAIGQTAIIDCTPPKRWDLPKLVRDLAIGHGITITDGAAETLINRVGEDTIYLDNELKKLALAHRGLDPVNENEVLEMVSRTVEVKPWEFVDAFAARNIRKCMLCLTQMESSSPHALLAMCTTRLRELICAKSLADRSMLQALPATLGLPDWRVKNHALWARNFSAEELREALISAMDAERRMKSGENEDGVFIEWVLQSIKRS
ncbi:DNA polymerase III subunit delta [Eggerthellaceae bacterium 3-80]|nr:DNA polymerase III subunit delta [bacterium D16-34]